MSSSIVAGGKASSTVVSSDAGKMSVSEGKASSAVASSATVASSDAGKMSVSEGSRQTGSSIAIAGKASSAVASSDSVGTTLPLTGKRPADAKASSVEASVVPLSATSSSPVEAAAVSSPANATGTTLHTAGLRSDDVTASLVPPAVVPSPVPPAVVPIAANSVQSIFTPPAVVPSPVPPAVVPIAANSVQSLSTSLSRTRPSTFTAMLVVKSEPANWAAPTLLLHFVEECQTSTVFRVSEAAREQFGRCQVACIYTMEIAHRAVQGAPGVHKYGVKARYEVVLKYPVKKLELSRAAWSLTFPYQFSPWSSLNQLPTNSIIDLFGVVLREPERDVNSSFPKLLVQLSNAGYHQEVALLGSQAATVLAPGSIVALSGLSLREYLGDRSLQTMFLTMIELNPDLSHLRVTPEKDFSEGRKRKAIHITPRMVIPTSEAEKICERLLTDAQNGTKVVATDCTLCGTLSKMSDKFFEDDPPIVPKGDREVVCWKTQLQDATGSTAVKVWNKASYSLFGITVDKMREYWGEGHECPERRADILSQLNAKLEVEVTCNCTVDVWIYGFRNKKYEVQINVNSLEEKDMET